MAYTFEDLPSTQPSIRAIKVMLGGRQVAVLECLSHHMHYQGNDSDWRLFRVSDRAQINDWPIMQPHRLEDVQRLVQAMDPSIFHKPASQQDMGCRRDDRVRLSLLLGAKR
jgi:hypothetical protein